MAYCEQQDLFISGEGGYARYRIPALLTTQAGTMLAFCEARKYTGRDSDQIDLFLRRSVDGGRTFGEVQVVATQEGWVCGNPAPVQDRDTRAGCARVWLLFCKNLEHGDETMICEGKAPRTVWVTHSDDEGATWAEPQEITDAVKPESWSWYATGPCHGIQLRSGRLLIPCDHIVLKDKNRQDPHHSHVLISDDHGATWRIGGITDEGTNESTAMETTDGWVYLNCRNKRSLEGGGAYRAVAWSQDGGETFSPIVHDAALPEPICQASVLRFTAPHRDGGDPLAYTLFSNPGSLDGRHHLTVRMSYNEGRTWPVARVLHEGPAAYSDLAIVPDSDGAGGAHIYCLYERGDDGPYERITLARFTLEWLTEDRP
jgi:sialidase-1